MPEKSIIVAGSALEIVDFTLPKHMKCGEEAEFATITLGEGDEVKLTVTVANKGKFCTIDIYSNLNIAQESKEKRRATARPARFGAGTFVLEVEGDHVLKFKCHDGSEKKHKCAAKIKVFQHL